MYEHKLEKQIRCPLEYGLDIFGGKWKSRIICVLAEKKILRYNSLKKELTDITDAVLASALKELMASGIIDRKQYNEIPPRVEYNLTDKGQSVIPILQQICEWSGVFHKSDPNNIMAQCQKCDFHKN